MFVFGFLAWSLVPGVSVAAAKKPLAVPGKAKVPPGKPEIFELEPRGIQRGIPSRIKLIGTNLIGLIELNLHNPKLSGHLLDEPEATTNEAWIEITAATNLARASYELSVKNTNAESSKLKLYVDDLPQAYEQPAPPRRKVRGGEVKSSRGDTNSITASAPLEERAGERRHKSTNPPIHQPILLRLPISFWGTLDPPGDADELLVHAKAGESLVFDVSAKSIGSKAEIMLSLFNEKGELIASNNGFDGGDPLLNVQIPANGDYRLRVSERNDAGSKEHFYRVSIGNFPVVVGCFPLGIPAHQETPVRLIGPNVPSNSVVAVKADSPGEKDVPIDPEKFRSRRALKVVANDSPEIVESEPNDSPARATKIPVPCVVNGQIWRDASADSRITHHASRAAKPSSASDADLFAFSARAFQTLVLETDAARHGSPVDTKIEVLYPDGKPVERLLLQAVRDSRINFVSIDSVRDDVRVDNWQEMELNQFMYMQGEVCRIFRMPQGPDSGFQFYNNGSKRLAYLDTTAIAHALDEPVYIVEPHPVGSTLVPNGLPVFTLYYSNDDDCSRKLGTDSHLLFQPPRDGDYLVRVTDTRGFQGERFAYRLTLREAKPDFKVTLNGANPTINAGSGREFSVVADRIDGFDGDIRIDVTNVPPGFAVSTPILIQAGHLEAKGTINPAPDATAPATNLPAIKVTATAEVPLRPILLGVPSPQGRGLREGISNALTSELSNSQTFHDVNSLGKITVADKPKLAVGLEPYDESETNLVERSVSAPPLEITIAPGQSVPAWLKVKRNGFDDLVTFNVEGLPHGVIVDNIGLNGVLIPKNESARQIFLTAAKWVPDIDRLCFARANQADNQTSLPVLLHVRRPPINAGK